MASTPAAGGDLISGLNDDLLLRILELLPDARDVVRTDALSRRWRGLWTTGVAALRFDSYSCSCYGARAWEVCVSPRAAERYLDFVNGALALRARAGATTRHYYAIRDLAISLDVSCHKTLKLVPQSMEAAQGWIRYAAENEVRSLLLELDVPSSHPEFPTMMATAITVVELASSAKLETMRLRLGHAARLGVGLPSPSSSVGFASLTELSLEEISVAGDLLSRLVSSPCCPSLRNLRLSDLEFLAPEELLIEADALLNLSMEVMDSMKSLQLRTPSLEVLRLTHCLELERFKVVLAPRLEHLKFWSEQPLLIHDVHGHLSSVKTLKIQLLSDEDYYNDDDDYNDGTFHILQCCSSARCLEVSLHVEEERHQIVDIIKGRFPPLPHVTSLTLNVTLWEPHLFGSNIRSFLAQCSNIRYLSLQLSNWTEKKLLDQDLLCENSCLWKSPKLYLAHLQEVEFKKLIGTYCELQFIRSILIGKARVRLAVVSFNPFYWRKDNKDASKLMPPVDGGSWTMCNDDNLSCKWRRYCI